MCKLEIKKEIGQRFRVFRQAIGKKQIQLARELKVSPSAISFIEMGTSFPKINYINYLHRYYRLNIDWLLGREVPMFLPVAREEKDCASFLPCHIPYRDPVYGMYVELMELMQVPGVGRAILEEAARIKRTFKNKQETSRRVK
jgi:transcriptional regulator with XRE-family HTH domain